MLPEVLDRGVCTSLWKKNNSTCFGEEEIFMKISGFDFHDKNFQGYGGQDTLTSCPFALPFQVEVVSALRNISVFLLLQPAVYSYTETGYFANRRAVACNGRDITASLRQYCISSLEGHMVCFALCCL